MTAMRRTFRNWGGRPWWFWRRLANRKARWTPNELSGSILAWWDAGAGITVTGAGVSSWVDRKSGYALVQSTDGARPAYSATGFNGVPGLTFDGTADFLTIASVPFPTGATPCEVWAIVQQDSVAAGTQPIMSYGAAGAFNRQLGKTTGPVPYAITGDGSLTNTALGNGAFGSRHLIRGIFGATTTSIELDGVADGSVASVPSTGTTRVRVGANIADTPTLFWNGKIRDVIVTSLLSADDAELLQAYLLNRRAL